jgi:hypothetical protein
MDRLGSHLEVVGKCGGEGVVMHWLALLGVQVEVEVEVQQQAQVSLQV